MLKHLERFLVSTIGQLPHPWRWITTVLLGVLLVALGIVLIPLPGPGLLVSLVGFAVLAIEFEWAREVVRKGEQGLEHIWRRLRQICSRKK
jgi:uncharacterized protein (TIGR02611 family)